MCYHDSFDDDVVENDEEQEQQSTKEGDQTMYVGSSFNTQNNNATVTAVAFTKDGKVVVSVAPNESKRVQSRFAIGTVSAFTAGSLRRFETITNQQAKAFTRWYNARATA